MNQVSRNKTIPDAFIVDSRKMDYNTGVKLLKLKYRDLCPIPELEDIWSEVPVIGFKELAKLTNLEERRIGLKYLPIEDIVKEVNPILLNSQTLDKHTTWITEEDKLETKKYQDTYKLYKVTAQSLGIGRGIRGTSGFDRYYVEFSCTSTGRKYFIWVDPDRIKAVNTESWKGKYPTAPFWASRDEEFLTAIQAIAWTITTDVPIGEIQEIIRQGDCIFIKPKGPYEKLSEPRHLSEKEYLNFLTNES